KIPGWSDPPGIFLSESAFVPERPACDRLMTGMSSTSLQGRIHGVSQAGRSGTKAQATQPLPEIIRQITVPQHLHLVLLIAEALLQACPEGQVGARVGVLECFIQADRT